MVFECTVAGNMTKCPLTRGVRLREVSVSGVSTVWCARIILRLISRSLSTELVFISTDVNWLKSMHCHANQHN